MRRQRRLPPGAWWSIVVRCARREFRLRPDKERVEAVGFFLSKALSACPGIKLVAFTQMSNHLHIVLRDDDSELSTLMCLFKGALARHLNWLDRTSGQVFERRFTATEILDRAAVLDQVAYAVTNPVKDGLVPSLKVWPGIIAWVGNKEDQSFGSWKHSRSARGWYELSINRNVLSPAELHWLRREVARRLRGFVMKHRRRGFLGCARVLRQSVFDSPAPLKGRPMPTCHASSLEDWWCYIVEWRLFREAYRRASEAFRAGNWSVAFPDYSFRPSTTVVQTS